MSQEADIRLAFMDILSFDDGAIRGGLLVTNLATHPYEFRTTSPIKPTTFQQLLYGVTLKEYLYSELIGLPLVRSVKEKMDILLVKDEKLLSIRPSISFPMLVIYQNENDLNEISLVPHKEYVNDEIWPRSILKQRDFFEPFDRVRVALKEVHKIRPEEKIVHG